MPDKQTPEQIIAASPFANGVTVDRNGVTKKLTVFIGKRGTWEDKPYVAPQIETDGTDSEPVSDSKFQESLKWTGKTNVMNFLNLIFRRFGQDYHEDATGDADTEKAGGLANGVFDYARLLTLWTELRTSAMKLSELNEARELAVAEYTAAGDELVAAFDSAEPFRISEAKKKMESAKATLVSLKAQFEERKARRSKEAGADTVAAV